MTFRQFVFNNVKRNFRSYFVYILCSTFSVLAFFTYLTFLFHPTLANNELGESITISMKAAAGVTLIFSFLFIFYSISTFLKTRQKEFGIVTVLGMTSRQWTGMILLENILIGLLTTILGVLLGMLLSKLILLIGSYVMEINPPLQWYFPDQAIWITMLTFPCLFIILSLFTRFVVRQKKALEMLKGNEKPKSEPKGSIWLALLSVGCLGVAYWLLTGDIDDETRLNTLLLLYLVGTYFFFTQMSLLMIRLLKRRRAFYWRGLRLIWVTEMVYKLKDNARMFFMITIVATMTCMAAGFMLVVHQEDVKRYQDNPFAFSYQILFPMDITKEKEKKYLENIEHTLQEAHVNYQRLDSTSVLVESVGTDSGSIEVMSQSDFNQFAKVLKLKSLSLKPNDSFYVYSRAIGKDPSFKLPNQVTLKQVKKTLKIKGHLEKKLSSDELLVVHDDLYKQLEKQQHSSDWSPIKNYLYYVSAWNDKGLPSANSTEARLSQQIYKQYQKQMPTADVTYLNSRAAEYLNENQKTNLYLFTGFFIATIFSIFSASFLYFRLFSDLQTDQRFNHMLSKIGMTWKEMKQCATVQIAALFYIPFIVTVICTWIGLSRVKVAYDHHVEVNLTWMDPTWMTIGAFFLIQTLYFLIIRAQYIRKMKQSMM